MKNTFYIVSIILFVSQIILGQDCESKVHIKTNHVSSSIFVNNSLAGKGEVTVLLNRGNHIIKIKDSVRKWDAEIIKDTITIDDCEQNKNLIYTLTPEYFVDSDPQDASVYKNDLLIGHTPMFVHNGVDKLALSKKDYKTEVIRLKEITGVNKIKLDFTGELKSIVFADTPWFKVLIGTAVIFGATAAYFKIQADKEYKKYLDTSDMKYLDETDRHDLYSGLAFGALQVNFGFLIYKLLSD